MRKIAPCIYVLTLAGVSWFSLKYPTLDFDLVPYIGLIELNQTADYHAATLNAIKLISGKHHDYFYSNSYRRDILENRDHFGAVLPFYSIKPLYIHFLRLTAAITGNLVLSTVIPSVLGYLGIGALLWLWIGRQNPWLAAVLAVQPVLIAAARASAPDALGTFVILLGAYLYWRRWAFPSVLAFMISIWIRPDALIYVGWFLLAMLFDYQIELRDFFITSALAASSWFTINHFGYNWTALYYNSFVEGLTDPGALTFHVTATMYLKQLFSAVMSLSLGYLTLYLLVGILGWKNQRFKRVLLPMLLGGVCHCFLYPSNEERLFLPVYLASSIAAAMVPSLRPTPVENHKLPNQNETGIGAMA